jgi:hypothetical protein
MIKVMNFGFLKTENGAGTLINFCSYNIAFIIRVKTPDVLVQNVPGSIRLTYTIHN